MARFRVPSLPIPPFLHGIPAPTIRIIALLVSINIAIWIVAGIILHFHPSLISPAALSYVLGLRHALDADHISAIDLMTRRLIASGQRPVTVGTFFSLGHSTIVIVTCVVVAATSGALRDRFDGFTRVGNIIGTSVSAAFLLLLCAGNGWVLYKLIRRLRVVLEQERRRTLTGEVVEEEDEEAATNLKLEGEGFLANVFRKGTSIWLILIFPVLFTAGMCLLDTTDGALMMALYTSKAFSRDRVAILYYSIVLTGITVFVSAFIGIIQVLSLIANVAEPEGSFWDGVDAIGEHFDIIGGSICGLFVVVGLGSVLVYRPWRARVDRKNQERAILVPAEEEALEPAEGPSYGAVTTQEPASKKDAEASERDLRLIQ
ncbi:High-affinity nickel transport protein nic1 [Colletotrichum sp. SAR 10_66]|nr:High-affinity nickel transport protein nic1 [Colletotrichum sp. SAR 10_66]